MGEISALERALNVLVIDVASALAEVDGFLREVRFREYDENENPHVDWIGDYVNVIPDNPNNYTLPGHMYLERAVEALTGLEDIGPYRQVDVHRAADLDSAIRNILEDDVDLVLFSTELGKISDRTKSRLVSELRVRDSEFNAEILYNTILTNNNLSQRRTRMIITPYSKHLLNLKLEPEDLLLRYGYRGGEYPEWVAEAEIDHRDIVEVLPKHYSQQDLIGRVRQLFRLTRNAVRYRIGDSMVWVGSTGTGKTELVEAYCRRFDDTVAVDYITTRSPRANENVDRVIEDGSVTLSGSSHEPGDPYFVSREIAERLLSQHSNRFVGGPWGPQEDLYFFDMERAESIRGSGRNALFMMAGYYTVPLLENALGKNNLFKFVIFAYPDQNRQFLTKRRQEYVNAGLDPGEVDARLDFAPMDYQELYNNRENAGIFVLNTVLNQDELPEVPSIELKHPIDMIRGYFGLWQRRRWPTDTAEFLRRMAEWEIEQATGMNPAELDRALRRGQRVNLQYLGNVDGDWEQIPNAEDFLATQILSFSRTGGRYKVVLRGPRVEDHKFYTWNMIEAYGAPATVRLDEIDEIRRDPRDIEAILTLAENDDFVGITHNTSPGLYIGGLDLDVNPRANPYGVLYVFSTNYPRQPDHKPFEKEHVVNLLGTPSNELRMPDTLSFLRAIYQLQREGLIKTNVESSLHLR